jgi:beta-glucanase (GH16 family)
MKNFANILTNAIATVLILTFSACQRIDSQKISEIPVPKIEGDFIMIPELSDEFDGSAFDTSKWFRTNPTWLGRQPAFFSENNVKQEDGKLNLTMRKEDPSEMLKEKGYHTYSSAAVRSKFTVKYGYFEIKSRAMNSLGSSAFWFYDQAPALWTEIDVFELCGKGERENQYNMNVHVFRTPLKEEHWSKGSEWRASYRFADEFHVFGLEWTPYVIRWYVDGVAVRTAENTHWHQPLTMNFDSETMPDWFGLPDDSDLPSTFSIEYVRSWKYKTAEWMNEGLWEKKVEEK